MLNLHFFLVEVYHFKEPSKFIDKSDNPIRPHFNLKILLRKLVMITCTIKLNG